MVPQGVWRQVHDPCKVTCTAWTRGGWRCKKKDGAMAQRPAGWSGWPSCLTAGCWSKAIPPVRGGPAEQDGMRTFDAGRGGTPRPSSYAAKEHFAPTPFRPAAPSASLLPLSGGFWKPSSVHGSGRTRPTKAECVGLSSWCSSTNLNEHVFVALYACMGKGRG